jgi:outer membrane protein assembly factor BamC
MTAGCSVLNFNDNPDQLDLSDYSKAKMSGDLLIPETVGQDNSQNLFIVPELMPESTGVVFGQGVDVPAPMQILTLGNDVRANKESRIASAFINDSEIAVWDLVSRFMENDQIALTEKQIAEGLLVTDWITKYKESFWWGDDIPVIRHRYRVRLLDAERPNETRLDVEVLAAEVYTSDEGWEPTMDATRAGAEFINQILGFKYVESINESRQRVAQSALGGITVSLGSDPDGNPALVTASAFEQAWDRVPLALQMVKMQVDDKDRSQGLYFVSLREDDEGFFKSLAFWSDDESDALDLERGNYRIQVTQEGARTYIVFTDTDDVPLQADVLARNFPQLSKAFKARLKEINNT